MLNKRSQKLLAFLGLAVILSPSCGIFRDYVDSVSYHGISNFHQVHPANTVTFMASLLTEPDKILIARTNYLTIYANGEEQIISGSTAAGYREGRGLYARYNGITGLVQVNESSIILVDRGNNVIRHFNLNTTKTNRHAGTAGTAGDRDHMLANALLNSPFGIIIAVLETNTFYLSDSASHKIRRLNETHLTTAYDGHPLISPKGMTLDTDNPLILYVVINHGIARINLLNRQAVSLNSAGTRGFLDGPIQASKFSSPENIVQVTSGSFIITDRANDRLRIYDRVNDTMSSICTGVRGEQNGEISECSLYFPKCMLIINTTLILIGEGPEIKALRLDDLSSQQVTQPETTATTTATATNSSSTTITTTKTTTTSTTTPTTTTVSTTTPTSTSYTTRTAITAENRPARPVTSTETSNAAIMKASIKPLMAGQPISPSTSHEEIKKYIGLGIAGLIAIILATGLLILCNNRQYASKLISSLRNRTEGNQAEGPQQEQYYHNPSYYDPVAD